MISNQIYYRVKPFIPWRLRMAARRMLAQRQRCIYSKTWPINEAAGKIPDGWPGWPEGKKFALVLTHDIEGASGFQKYPGLMRLEQSLGFRSSFNFIPEGEYRVARNQIAELKQNGFEVGVHDLRHDGKLFWQRGDFTESARAINGYIRDWGARGFRAGFMLHDLACLNELEIEYDASTFDTDPFEPQPEGAHTIFPFWVTRPSGGGYVELPYTLAQDSTMFFVLQETTLDIWKKKLDWIAQRGGMALLNVHPDYVNFGNSPRQPWEYSADLYREFLQYAAQKYGGTYWQALPQQVAAWYRENCVTPEVKNSPAVAQSLKNKNAAVVLYSYYASDPRPRRETEALAQAGMNVDVICLRQDADEPTVEVIDGVTVHRVPLKRRRAGKFTYAFQYAAFLTSSFFMLTWWRMRRRIDLVHVHNMPDFLVFSALLPKILGARVILDLHDPMPELLVTIFGLKEKSFGVRLLKFMEKLSVGFADQVLTVNRACEQIFSARSCPPEKIQVLMNVPDERVFKFRSCLDYPPRDDAKPFVIMFHGSIVERNGLDIAVDALRLLRTKVPSAELWVYGADTPFLQKVMDPVALNGLGGAVKYLGRKSQKEIVAAIQGCDVGVIPNRNNAFTEINTPTRIFEYLSVGKPVVAPRAKGITDYFGADDLVFFELGDAPQLAERLEFMYRNPDRTREIAGRGQEIYQQQRWNSVRGKFIGRVCGLLGIPGGEEVIAVAASENDRAVAAEFFELFKTPWKFFQPGDSANVLLCTQNEIPASNAKLVLIYGSGLNSFDRAQKVSVQPQPAGKIFAHDRFKFPMYGPGLAFENAGLYEVKNGAQTVIRIGYDLFGEVHHLLTAGQPAEYAGIPALDEHIALLRGLIVRHAAPLVEIPPVPAGKNFIVCLTHDVDHVGIRNHKFDHTMLGFLARATVGSVLDLMRGKKTVGQMFTNWLAVLKLPFVHLGLAKDFWYQFDHYVEIENGLPSTFFIIPKKGETGLDANGNRPAKRAASYDAHDLEEILRGLKTRGKEVCVHGIDAWRDVSAGLDEKKIITGLAGTAESGIRMHWLYFSGQSHEILEQGGFAYDSTVGYNGTVGYRAGTTQVFKPLMAKNLLELPMHAMDTALFYPSYLNLTPGQAAEKIAPLVAHTADSGGTLVVNWHDRSIAPERLWDGSYVALIDECKKSGAWFATAGQAVDWFRARRSINFENGGSTVRTGNFEMKNLPALRVRVHASPEKFDDRELRDSMEVAAAV